jgi:uncharacterized SAM-binding protein YcdF (DUF218 family)
MSLDAFVLVRFAGQLLDPLNAVWVLAAVGVVRHLWRRKWRAALGWYAAALVWLGLLGWEPAGTLAFRSLEGQYTAPTPLPADIEGMVVLGGGAESDSVIHDGPGVTADYSIERLSQSLVLARAHPQWTVLFTGEYGKASTLPIQRTEARSALAYWESKGLPRNNIELEERSHNTAENAFYAAQHLGDRKQKKWLLVTSAWHMPRAMTAFALAGVNVVPYPVDYRAPQTLMWSRYSLSKGRYLWHMTCMEHAARLALVFQMPRA